MGQAIDRCRVCGSYASTSDEEVCEPCYREARAKLTEAMVLLRAIEAGTNVKLSPVHARSLLLAISDAETEVA